MQIVIDIPKTTYENLAEIANAGHEPLGYAERTILRGIPLPKGHGRLIDADKTLLTMNTFDKFGYLPHDLIPLRSENSIKLIPYVHYDDMVKCIIIMPTIIEADKEVEDDR